MSCASEYAPQLRSRGFRVTPQRMAVLHVLRHAGVHLSPAQVYEQARRELPRLTEATVYRTLDFLAKNGLAWPVYLGNGHLAYEMAESRHHHIVCRECGDEITVDYALLKDVYGKLEAASGYQLTADHLTLFGLCPECRRAKTTKGH